MNKLILLFFLTFFPILYSNTILGDSYHDSPESYVGSIAKETLNALNISEEENDKKIEIISQIFLSNLAIKEISLFVLGPYRRSLKEEQRKEYFELLKNFISEIYSVRLASYPSGKFKILSTSDSGRSGIIVKTLIEFSDNPNPTKIDWRLIKKKNGEFKIFDIRVVGVWMAQEQRSTFTSFLSKNNGNIDNLIDRIKSQLKKEG
tara:strand:- start:942 stop:1556 length:615 start_codon:yes stop_codon:yes gene_type:complete